jgi:Septum formation
MPYAGGQYGVPVPPPRRSRKGLIIALCAVGAVVLIGIVGVAVLYFAFKDTAIATDMKVGDCISAVPTGAEVMTLPTVDCAQPHAGEVFAVLDMPDGAYPGGSTIAEWQNKCPAELGKFAPNALTDDSVGVYVLYPTQDTWGKGDRAITCIATLDPKRAGSLKG